MRLAFSVIFMSLFCVISCDINYQGIVVSGVITDNNSGYPIPGANVRVKNWYYDTEIWESRFVEKSVFSDSLGFFELQFERGEAFDLEVFISGDKRFSQSVTLNESNNHLDILIK